MFKNIQSNRHPLQRAVQSLSIKRTVTFQNDVIVHRLVRPDIVYFCQKPLVSQLNLEQHCPIRKLLGLVYLCTCVLVYLCTIQKGECALTACDSCFGAGKVSPQLFFGLVGGIGALHAWRTGDTETGNSGHKMRKVKVFIKRMHKGQFGNPCKERDF